MILPVLHRPGHCPENSGRTGKVWSAVLGSWPRVARGEGAPLRGGLPVAHPPKTAMRPPGSAATRLHELGAARGRLTLRTQNVAVHGQRKEGSPKVAESPYWVLGNKRAGHIRLGGASFRRYPNGTPLLEPAVVSHVPF